MLERFPGESKSPSPVTFPANLSTFCHITIFMSAEVPNQCKYCGCAVSEVLIKDPISGCCFCNGKGYTRDSHAVHFLKRTGRCQIELSQPSKHILCTVCGSSDVFRLGTVKKGQDVVIVCRNPCLFDHSLGGIDRKSFLPLIVDGCFQNDIVRIPKDGEYKRISKSQAARICREIKQGKVQQRQAEKREIRPTKLTYESFTEYEEVMKDFVNLEREMDMILARKISYQGVKIQWEQGSNGQWLGKFRAPIRLFKGVSVGNSIVFKRGSQTIRLPVLAKRMKGLLVTVSCDSEKVETVRSAKAGSLSLDVNDLVYRRQISGLKAFGNLQNLDEKLQEVPIVDKDIAYTHVAIRSAFLGNMNQFKKRNLIRRNPLTLIPPESRDFPPLNHSQMRACEIAMKQHVSLIQGPPGTGKTTVIAALAHSFVKQGHRVLIVAHTNIAVDNATVKVAAAGLKPVRVYGATSEETPEVAQFSSKRFVKKDETEFEDEHEAISKAEVVLTTTGCIGGKRFRMIPFEKVIVDEAGQCPDPDILPAVLRNSDQLILVGDHKQLGPFALSALSRKGSYTMSLMLRLVALKQMPLMLTQQYRMHPDIAYFSSREFYLGLLESGVTREDRVWKGDTISWPNPGFPLLFWNTKGEEQTSDGGTSYCNIEEGRALAKLLGVLDRNGVQGTSVAVITPYIGQVNFLNDLLQEELGETEFFADLEIDTVDAFQGREKDFVIFSCVRGNNDHRIGFLSDLTRMNVALTRARYGLIVLGTANVFSRNDAWANFIEYCQQSNALVEGDLNEWAPSTFARTKPEKVEEEESDYEGDE